MSKHFAQFYSRCGGGGERRGKGQGNKRKQTVGISRGRTNGPRGAEREIGRCIHGRRAKRHIMYRREERRRRIQWTELWKIRLVHSGLSGGVGLRARNRDAVCKRRRDGHEVLRCGDRSTGQADMLGSKERGMLVYVVAERMRGGTCGFRCDRDRGRGVRRVSRRICRRYMHGVRHPARGQSSCRREGIKHGRALQRIRRMSDGDGSFGRDEDAARRERIRAYRRSGDKLRRRAYRSGERLLQRVQSDGDTTAQTADARKLRV